MTATTRVLTAVSLLASALVATGVAAGATTFPDRPNDQTPAAGPDIRSVMLSHTRTTITFRVRFATAPPLRVSTKNSWVDMLLIGIDVPPIGPPPRAPGAEWPGADFAWGTHGPSSTALLVRLGSRVAPAGGTVATLAVVTRGSTVSVSIRRRALGDPAWFRFSVAAAREAATPQAEGGVDLAPDRGTFRYSAAG